MTCGFSSRLRSDFEKERQAFAPIGDLAMYKRRWIGNGSLALVFLTRISPILLFGSEGSGTAFYCQAGHTYRLDEVTS